MKNFIQHNKSLFSFILAAFFCGLAFSAGASFFSNRSANANETATVLTPEDLGNAFSSVADMATPAVVQITTTEKVKMQANPFQEFFRMNPFGGGEGEEMMPEESERQGLGSGAIIRGDGYIVTNNHVIDGATTMDVLLADGRKLPAKVVGKDKANDLAVIKIEASNLPTLQFGDANSVKVGQWVVAIGSPFDPELSNTVTAGIVSALGRGNPTERNSLTNYIQTDAAINPGNSGGPLLNLQGKIVGINSAIKSRSGGFEGIGFAIPVDIVKNITDQLINNGSVKRAMLGVNITNLSPSLARALNAPAGGARVASFRENSVAERAGVQVDDVIVGVDGKKLQNSSQLPSIIANKSPNSVVQLQLLRDGREITIPVKLAERVEEQASTAEGDAPEFGGESAESTKKQNISDLGFSVRDLTSALRQQYKLGDIKGVFVADVTASSVIARESNLGNTAIITGIGKTSQASRQNSINNVNDFMTAYSTFRSGETMFLRGVQPARDGSTSPFFTAITKP